MLCIIKEIIVSKYKVTELTPKTYKQWITKIVTALVGGVAIVLLLQATAY